ncbi:MAG: hypothetical protein K5928_00550 [Prevotella sp.]|nr:hypothetical protein [Prevotella sp.]
MKYKLLSLAAIAAMSLTSCSDDATDQDAPRLFRPVATLEVSGNSIITTWDNIKEATTYELVLSRVTATDELGNNSYEQVATATVETAPYVWQDLAWDEKYKVDILCRNSSKKSATYSTDPVNINYLSSLSGIKLIDNAARISWNQGGDSILFIKAVPVDNAEAATVEQSVKKSAYETGYVDIYGLTAETQYVFYTYKSQSEQSNSTYAGKLTGTTKASIDFDEKYGAGKWLDIRSYDPDEAKDTLKSEVFWQQVADGTTIILRGEQDYKVNNSIKLDRSVTFVTGSTLGGNARFISSGGITCAAEAVIDKVKFEDIDFISDKALPDGGNEIATNTDKGFGGRQVLNNNNTKSTIKELFFDGCTITGYRAVVRAQNASDAIQSITFKGCTINGIGDQGVVTTTNKAADWQNVTFTDCTVTNIVMLCDLRATAGALTFAVNQCTFCYAPIETTANKNTPLFRFGTNMATLKISNSLFGPSMASTGSTGDDCQTYQAGTAGSIFLDNLEAQVSASHSFKTNFDWTLIGEATYPIDQLTSLSMDEHALWKAPASGDYTVIGNIGESGIGATKWQQ